MKAEYFPPKEDVILQNEAPMDFYVLVTGAMVVMSPKTKSHCLNISRLILTMSLLFCRICWSIEMEMNM